MITVVIVEDRPEHQHYFKSILAGSTKFKCIGVYSMAQVAINAIIRDKPEIVILDIGLPDMSGIDCIRAIRKEKVAVKFMVCTVHENDANIFEALKAGANSYFLKRNKPYQIIDALIEMYHGHMPISNFVATKLLNHIPVVKYEDVTKEATYCMTKQEERILILLSRGASYQEVADTLSLTLSTIKWHIHNILVKLKVKNRLEAVNKYFSD